MMLLPDPVDGANKNLSAFRRALEKESASFGAQLSEEAIMRLGRYFELIQKWNPRLHLVAPCSPGEFATRHVLESLTLLRHLNESARVIDIGSGGGLPIIPCLIARPDLHGTLIEASAKKTVFLREALKEVAPDQAQVINQRFEVMEPPEAEFVSCRALEHFQELLPRIIEWSPTKSTLLLFGGEGVRTRLDEVGRSYNAELLPNSGNRFLFVVEPAQ
jgi:16S rRNA (guanine527-N7)-methyltransferase